MCLLREVPDVLQTTQSWNPGPCQAVRELTDENRRPEEGADGGRLAASSLTLDPAQATALALFPLSLHSIQEGLSPAPSPLFLLSWPFWMCSSFFLPPHPHPSRTNSFPCLTFRSFQFHFLSDPFRVGPLATFYIHSYLQNNLNELLS